MPRPLKPRWINTNPGTLFFAPHNVPFMPLNQILLTLDELEALRLADLMGLNQEDAAGSMYVSRATFGRIVARARGKVADALIHGKEIRIDGGEVRFHPPGGPHRWGRGPQGRHGHGKGPWNR